MASKSSPPEGVDPKETAIPMPGKATGSRAHKDLEGLIDYSLVTGANLFSPPVKDSPLYARLKGLKKAGLVSFLSGFHGRSLVSVGKHEGRSIMVRDWMSPAQDVS